VGSRRSSRAVRVAIPTARTSNGRCWPGALVTTEIRGVVELHTASSVTLTESTELVTRVTATGRAVPVASTAAGGQTSSVPGPGSDWTGACALAAPNRARSVLTPASAPSTSPALGPAPTPG